MEIRFSKYVKKVENTTTKPIFQKIAVGKLAKSIA
jgi:hypothetical protein